ncbi:hypothetical protein [Hymenobacter jeollabukensis]|uniref:Uncharacterized protein n=1 Tax=Hymenobacter jeollabukensis TaxID=2025313 RepID=A0A5R8WQZ2_9BACT|nr:hypothetical protein [Hymenobacter jeollabukensis]TLM93106.1 hypothetical protein FDY95_10760 [Hymenobacter jeollabukensis]
MSHFPDLPAEPGQEHLRRALHSMPQHEPDDALWTRISAHIDTDAAVSRALPELPAHEPDDDLWAVIVGRLDHEAAAPAPFSLHPAAEAEADIVPLHAAPAAEMPAEPAAPLQQPGVTHRWLTQPWHWATTAAAAVLVLAVVWWQRPLPVAAPAAVARVSTAAPEPAAATETISYGEEVLPTDQAATATFVGTAFDPLQAQGVAFIDAHCTSLPTVCQTTEFQELRTELAELEAEEQRLQKDAKRFGTSPELEQNQARVTTQKATVTRELIQLLIS